MDQFQAPLLQSENLSYNDLKIGKANGRKKKERNKQKAESQFNFSAAPIKLEVFFQEALEIQPDDIDFQAPIDGNEEYAPMTCEPNVYPSNADELAVGILEVSNSYLEIVESNEQVNSQPETNVVENIAKQMDHIVVASTMSKVDVQHMKVRNKTPKLTAKRLSVKALQLFSFNKNYDKHFTMDKTKLRNMNTDMIIDHEYESKIWLNMLGTHYSDKIKSELNIFDDDINLLTNLRATDKYHKILGFSLILKNLGEHSLLDVHSPIHNHVPQTKNTIFENVSLLNILEYYGIMMFGITPELNFQLNYLHLIPYYLKSSKKKIVYDLFEYLDHTKRNRKSWNIENQ